MIWLKRLAPFIIIVAAIWIWRVYANKQAEAKAALEHRYALITAKVWVASAMHRADPDEFLRVRDSLLATCSLSTAEVLDFVETHENEPENLHPYSRLVQEYVDSLLDIEDSLSLVREDSLRQADSTTQ